MTQKQQQIIFRDKCYTIISIEQEYLIHPSVFSREEPAKEILDEEFNCVYHIQNSRLTVEAYDGPVPTEQKQTGLWGLGLRYSGAILIGQDPVREYPLQENSLPCYSYRSVYELVFNHGILVTTVDQSRAMLRIRRNLELGYRSLIMKRDVNCIHKFLNSCFIGDYRPLTERKKRKIIKEMKNLYPEEEK